MTKDVRVRFLEEAYNALESEDFKSIVPYVYKMLKGSLMTAPAFLLPANGFFDGDFKGVSDTVRCPFKQIVLLAPPKSANKTPTITVVTEADKDGTVVLVTMLKDNNNLWYPSPVVAYGNPIGASLDGDEIKLQSALQVVVESDALPLLSEDGKAYLLKITSASFRAYLELLQVLSCSNVGYKKNNRAKSKYTDRPLMYDEYYTLTVDTGGAGKGNSGGCITTHSGRHPREHLCRGHIRNQPYKDGVIKRIWINAVIKGAGNGGGKITKAYEVKKC